MEILRTSEIGKRLKEEWPDAYTTFAVNVDSHTKTSPKVRMQLYHEKAGWCEGRTFEECIEKVKAALAPKTPPPDETEIVIDSEIPDGPDPSTESCG